MKRTLIPVLAAFAGIVGVAQAKQQPLPPPDFVIGSSQFDGVVHDRGDHATLNVQYTCAPGTADHLWFSIKQSADGSYNPDTSGEGSGFGGKAATWYQSHRGSFTCDNKKHTAHYTADLIEPGSRGDLVKGVAYVQFCLTNSALPQDDPNGLVVIRQQWVKVR